MRSRSALILIGIGWLAGAACGLRRLDFSPAELRELIARQVPEIPPEQIVIPYEVDARYVTQARRLLTGIESELKKAEVLGNALLDPRGFGIQYSNAATTTGNQALAQRRGNCLAIAAAYVGLSRAVGLNALFMDVSGKYEETRERGDVIVHTGHVTAVVEAERQRRVLDLGDWFRLLPAYRIIADQEFVAHFYNNRGYELLETARAENRPIDWAEVAFQFRIATQIRPNFKRGWNNLGVAYGHLGKIAEAERCYRTAAGLDPDFAAPRSNLGLLLLSQRKLVEALLAFDESARLDPRSPFVHYYRGLALDRLGRRPEAARALEEALDRADGDLPRARRLLQRVYRDLGRSEDAERLGSPPAPTRVEEPR